MSDLFGRRAILEVGKAGTDGLRIEEAGAEASLRISFEVTKTAQSDSNKAVVQVYNLARASRERFARHDIVRLQVGYSGVMELAYEGEVTRARNERVGAEVVSTLECGDGVEAFQAQTIEKTFAAGATVSAVVLAVAKRFETAVPDREASAVSFAPHASRKTKASRLSLRNLPADLAVLERSLKAQGFATVLRRAMSVSGSAREVMDRLARMWRFDWSVQDGAVQVVAYGETLVGQAVLLSPSTGLLAVPIITDIGVRVRALLIPYVRPGSMLQVESDTVTGSFRTETVRLQGDTRGGPWELEAEARSL